jgi:hypothetical protein
MANVECKGQRKYYFFPLIKTIVKSVKQNEGKVITYLCQKTCRTVFKKKKHFKSFNALVSQTGKSVFVLQNEEKKVWMNLSVFQPKSFFADLCWKELNRIKDSVQFMHPFTVSL